MKKNAVVAKKNAVKAVQKRTGSVVISRVVQHEDRH